MNILTGLCAIVFALLAPVIALAGILVMLGVDSPIALTFSVCTMIGAAALWWLR